MDAKSAAASPEVLSSERVIALLIPLLPAIGAFVRWIALSAGTRIDFVDVAVGAPLSSLAALGAVAVLPGAAVFVVAALWPIRTSLNKLTNAWFGGIVLVVLSLIAASVLFFPGGVLATAFSVLSGSASGFQLHRLEGRRSWTALLPTAAIVAVGATFAFGLAGLVQFSVTHVEFVDHSPIVSGNYIDLGRTGQSVYLVSCGDPDRLLVVPVDSISLERVGDAPRPSSLWEVIRGERSFHLGAILDCSVVEVTP